MAGGEPRLGIAWMNMHAQSATNRRRQQEQERDLHAYNPGAGRPEFVQSQSLAPIASKKLGLGTAFITADLGAAELLLGLVVAVGFVGCAAQGRDRHEAT